MGYLGWAANAVLIAGAVLLGEKSPGAFVLIMIGEGLWAYKAYRMKQRDMLFICVAFGLLAARNLCLWAR